MLRMLLIGPLLGGAALLTAGCDRDTYRHERYEVRHYPRYERHDDRRDRPRIIIRERDRDHRDWNRDRDRDRDHRDWNRDGDRDHRDRRDRDRDRDRDHEHEHDDD